MTNPKITIIIPTRERSGVLEHSLRTATAQDYDNLEIIVSDNCSGDNTRNTVYRVDDSRIRYLNTGKRLSMSHNWEFALSHVEDGWVTFMGDDDGLLPTSVCTIAAIIQATQAKVIRSNACTYDWPGLPGRGNGQLIVPLTSGTNWRNSRRWLDKALHGSASYAQLPMIYNGGFIHIDILRRIKDRMGSFFSSANPDIYTAVAIARITDDYLYVRDPLAINGTSKYSNGYSTFSTSKERDDQPQKQFLDEDNIPFHHDLPPRADGGVPLSLQACVYEAYLQSWALGKQINGISHAQQLEVILATAGRHRNSIESWGKIFADIHDLDYGAALRSATLTRAQLQTSIMLGKIARAVNSVIVDNLPVRNVYDASIAASVIRSAPGRVDSMRFLVRQTLNVFDRLATRNRR